MAQISQETLKRVVKFKSSDQFTRLAPETQNRINRLLGDETTSEVPSFSPEEMKERERRAIASDPFSQAVRRDVMRSQPGINRVIASFQKKPDERIERLQDISEGIYREAVSPALSGVSTALGGYPKQLLSPERRAEIFPEQESDIGKVWRIGAEAAGLLGGVGAKAGAYVGKKLVPEVSKKIGLNAGLLRMQVIDARKRALAFRDVSRQIVENATFGAVQATSSEESGVSVGGQASQAVGAGALGLVLGLVNPVEKFQKGISPITRAWRKWTTPTSPERLARTKRLKQQTSDAQKSGITSVESKQQISLSDLEKRGEAIKKQKEEFGELHEEYQKEVLREAEDVLNENIEVLKAKQDQAALRGSLQYQKELPVMFRESSAAYGDNLDMISKGLVDSGEEITIGEVSRILQNADQEMTESLITEGPARNAFLRLKEKYDVDFIGGMSKFRSAATGEPVSGAIKLAEDQPVKFEELFNDLKRVKKSLSSGAKSGSTRWTQEDTAVAILQNNLGNYLKDRIPDFANLQSSYAPHIQMMKAANRIFKPYKGEYDIKSGASFLKRVSSRNPLEETAEEIGERKLIRDLESGSEFSAGLTNVRETLRRATENLQQAKQSRQRLLEDIKDHSEMLKRSFDKDFASQITNLQKQKSFIEAESAQQEAMIHQLAEQRMRQIGMREDVIRAIKEDKARFNGFIRKMLGVGVGISVLGTAYHTIKNIGK